MITQKGFNRLGILPLRGFPVWFEIGKNVFNMFKRISSYLKRKIEQKFIHTKIYSDIELD